MKGAVRKLKPHVEKIGRNGEIKIPGDYLKTPGLCPGEEVELKLAGRKLLVEPVKEAVAHKKKRIKDPVEVLTGILEIDDPDVEKLIADEAWYD